MGGVISFKCRISITHDDILKFKVKVNSGSINIRGKSYYFCPLVYRMKMIKSKRLHFIYIKENYFRPI